MVRRRTFAISLRLVRDDVDHGDVGRVDVDQDDINRDDVDQDDVPAIHGPHQHDQKTFT
jgi:hypothetical protein